MPIDEGIESENQTYPRFCVGTYEWGGEKADALLTHASPPDQENIVVVLLEDFICTERGKVIEIQRRNFKPEQLQEDL